jgi:hypothetical protein
LRPVGGLLFAGMGQLLVDKLYIRIKKKMVNGKKGPRAQTTPLKQAYNICRKY